MGRLTFNGSKETLQVKGKTLTKQEAIFTDNTGSIRVVLWEKDIQRVTTGTCYNIRNIAVKEYGVTKYLTLARHSTIDPLQDPVTWYGINYAGTQMTQWDFQNKGTRTSPARLSFVLEVPLRHLRPSVIYSVPCDRILQRAY